MRLITGRRFNKYTKLLQEKNEELERANRINEIKIKESNRVFEEKLGCMKIEFNEAEKRYVKEIENLKESLQDQQQRIEVAYRDRDYHASELEKTKIKTEKLFEDIVVVDKGPSKTTESGTHVNNKKEIIPNIKDKSKPKENHKIGKRKIKNQGTSSQFEY